MLCVYAERWLLPCLVAIKTDFLSKCSDLKNVRYGIVMAALHSAFLGQVVACNASFRLGHKYHY